MEWIAVGIIAALAAALVVLTVLLRRRGPELRCSVVVQRGVEVERGRLAPGSGRLRGKAEDIRETVLVEPAQTWHIELQGPDGVCRAKDYTPPLRLGRSDARAEHRNELFLGASPYISRVQCELCAQGAQAVLIPVSAGGTLLNGALLTGPALLRAGDVIGAGGEYYRVLRLEQIRGKG